jgi:hypothetical protein
VRGQRRRAFQTQQLNGGGLECKDREVHPVDIRDGAERMGSAWLGLIAPHWHRCFLLTVATTKGEEHGQGHVYSGHRPSSLVGPLLLLFFNFPHRCLHKPLGGWSQERAPCRPSAVGFSPVLPKPCWCDIALSSEGIWGSANCTAPAVSWHAYYSV